MLTQSFLRLALVTTTVVVAMLGPCAGAASVAIEEVSLRDRLVSGLQARRPSELEFIDAVIDTVDRGELPERLVDRFFFWARHRTPRSGKPRRPIVDFRAGLTAQAEKLGITIASTPEG